MRTLHLGIEQENTVFKIAEENKKDWELWVESASDYVVLTKKLFKRGYKQAPLCGKPMLLEQNKKITETIIQSLPNQKTMIRKGRKY